MRCLVVGHLVRDIIIRGSQIESRIGGGAYYSAVALSNFCDVEVLTSVGEDFPEEWLEELRRMGIRLKIIPSERSTSYRLHYLDSNTRELSLLSTAEKIEGLPDERYDIILLNPVAGEVPPRTVEEAKEKAPFVAADVQGFIRDPEVGKLRLKDIRGSTFEGLKVLHADVVEIGFVSGLRPESVEVLLISNGSEEGRAYLRGRAYLFRPARVPVDESTGAGDVFLATFSYFYTQCPFIQALKRAGAYTALFLKHRDFHFSMEDVDELALKVGVRPL
ncbi:carbohydrate kinase [Thermococcus siculi]|uniref:Carbohydrate kinase n=1 Tax=Thermococcus siculi TaxID=72803 RepID=A0A2Z2MUS0_9EURY|nr:carbohydrate kinase [Thermococcus siculi]ASJ07903.1 carbohydrate kinase [Thermococcus siculi]